MIGELEEQYHYNGDSIETALLACDNDFAKVSTCFAILISSYNRHIILCRLRTTLKK